METEIRRYGRTYRVVRDAKTGRILEWVVVLPPKPLWMGKQAIWRDVATGRFCRCPDKQG